MAEWKKLIESYLQERETLKLSCLILDARRGWMDKDLDLKQWLEHHGRPYLVVATKTDKLNQIRSRARSARHPQGRRGTVAVLGRHRPGSEGNLASNNENTSTT